MSEWRECKFKELFLIPLKNGLTKPSRIRGCGLRMVNMKEIFGFNFIDDKTPMECVPVSENEIKNSLLSYDDLLFARQSLTEEGAGKISIFKGKEETVFESHLIRCRIDKIKAIPDFIYYLFKSPIGRGTVSTIVQQVAAAGIRGSDLQNLDFRIPPLPEQKAIAAVLSSLDDKIDLLHRQNLTLEAMAETLFQQWFVVDARADWEEGTLDDLVEFNYGKTLRDQERSGYGFPVYGSSGIVGYHNEYLVEAPGIITGRKGTLGVINYSFQNFSPIDTTFYITSKIKSDGLFFEYFLLKTLNLGEMNSDSAVPGLNKNLAHGIQLTIPPIFLIEKFNQQVKPLFKKLNINQIQIQTLESLRDTLLPKLMSGEVRIKCR